MKGKLKASLIVGIVAVLSAVTLGAAYVTATTFSNDQTTPASNPPIIYDADDLIIMQKVYQRHR